MLVQKASTVGPTGVKNLEKQTANFLVLLFIMSDTTRLLRLKAVDISFGLLCQSSGVIHHAHFLYLSVRRNSLTQKLILNRNLLFFKHHKIIFIRNLSFLRLSLEFAISAFTGTDS